MTSKSPRHTSEPWQQVHQEPENLVRILQECRQEAAHDHCRCCWHLWGWQIMFSPRDLPAGQPSLEATPVGSPPLMWPHLVAFCMLLQPPGVAHSWDVCGARGEYRDLGVLGRLSLTFASWTGSAGQLRPSTLKWKSHVAAAPASLPPHMCPSAPLPVSLHMARALSLSPSVLLSLCLLHTLSPLHLPLAKTFKTI